MTHVQSDRIDTIIGGRIRRRRRYVFLCAILAVLLLALALVSLMYGDKIYGLDEIIRVIAGENVRGASFAVGEIRLPCTATALLTGFAFGVAGSITQTLLRNPLASPDIIGITQGASTGAVLAIVFFSAGDTAVSFAALGGALATAAAIYLLAHKGTFQGTRLILIGIGVAAMLSSVSTYALSRAVSWDLQVAMRWMSGSLNSATWSQLSPLALTCLVVLPLVFANTSNMETLRLGSDTATGLGTPVARTRIILLLSAVILLALATSASGPISFVAFMAGPIASRLVGPSAPILLPAGLVGALLVLGAEFVGHNLLPGNYPVGIITGALGAPYLMYLLIRTNRAGGSL
ncbi:iron chelate uptake ABC transporter family permease subunit [Arcanobacterium haemolyticum]|nr:iron chelate uptake ABC transporter family permease subunit [Arcanobacterium haemolyticum]